MNSKTLNIVLGLAALVFGAIAIYFALYAKDTNPIVSNSQQSTAQQQSSESNTPEQTPVEEDSQNSTYSNSKYGFSFEYPAGWYVTETEIGEGGNVMELSFAKATANKNTLQAALFLNISARQYYGDTPLTLDGAVKDLPKEQYQVNNPKNIKIGSNIAARRFDDGGGLFGTTYTTVAVGKGFTYILSALDSQKEAESLISKTFKITK